MKLLLNELEIRKSLLFLFETLVLATVWFFVLKAFSGLNPSDIPFAAISIYILGFVSTYAIMYILVRLSISMRTLSQDIIDRMEIQDDVAQRRRHRRHGLVWVTVAVVFVICTVMATQGPAILGAHLVMPFVGKPALADGIRNFAIGMAVVGNLFIFVPSIVAWAGIKLLHKRVIIVQHKMTEGHSLISNSEEVGKIDIEQMVARLSRTPIPKREVQHFPMPLTGPVHLAKSHA